MNYDKLKDTLAANAVELAGKTDAQVVEWFAKRVPKPKPPEEPKDISYAESVGLKDPTLSDIEIARGKRPLVQHEKDK